MLRREVSAGLIRGRQADRNTACMEAVLLECQKSNLAALHKLSDAPRIVASELDACFGAELVRLAGHAAICSVSRS